MREITEIILHCSDSDFGNRFLIDKWHKVRGWDGIGYHVVFLNGFSGPSTKYQKGQDGQIEYGRDFEIQGAHCLGHNQTSIGIVLIGKSHFTSRQLFDALPNFLIYLFNRFNLSPARLFGHYEFNQNKTCPNFNMVQYRKYLEVLWITEMTNLELKEKS